MGRGKNVICRILQHFSTELFVTFLACPLCALATAGCENLNDAITQLQGKKGDPKKGTRRKFFTACSVVLGTFRKLALRAQTPCTRALALVSTGCRQSTEMFYPRTQSPA